MVCVPTVCRAAAGGANLRGHALKIGNEVAVGAVRLALFAFERFEYPLDAVDGRQHQRDGFARCRRAVAELAHQRLGGVRQRFQPRQIQKSTSPLDSVDEAENVVEDLGVVGILLKTDEFDVDHVETFIGLGHELP